MTFLRPHSYSHIHLPQSRDASNEENAGSAAESIPHPQDPTPSGSNKQTHGGRRGRWLDYLMWAMQDFSSCGLGGGDDHDRIQQEEEGEAGYERWIGAGIGS